MVSSTNQPDMNKTCQRVSDRWQVKIQLPSQEKLSFALIVDSTMQIKNGKKTLILNTKVKRHCRGGVKHDPPSILTPPIEWINE